MAIILPVVPVLAVLGVVVVLPWVFIGGLVIIVVGVLNWGSLLRGRVATVVPDPLCPRLPGLIQPDSSPLHGKQKQMLEEGFSLGSFSLS